MLRLAVSILAQNGFKNIRWQSLVDWTCHYDFEAVKDGTKYLIEVKPSLAAITEKKAIHLKRLEKPTLFLIVERDKYAFIPLEKIEQYFGVLKIAYQLRVSTQGRTTIPDEIREKLNIKKGTFLEMEVYGTKKILITVMG